MPKILHACEEPARPRRDVYTKLDEVTAQRNAARATEKAAKAQYDMAKNGAEREDKAAAAALVERAKGAVAEVESYIKETYLIAQTAGEVSEIFPK